MKYQREIVSMLYYMIGRNDEIIFELCEGSISINGTNVEVLPENIKYHLQIELMLKQLGYVSIGIENFILLTEDLLNGKSRISSNEIKDIIKKSTFYKNTKNKCDDRVDKWRREMIKRIAESGSEGVFDKSELLYRWPEKILNDVKWSYSSSFFNDVPPIPIDKIWVDLNLIEDSAVKNTDYNGETLDIIELKRKKEAFFHESTETIIGRLNETSVIAGSPGSGKTTLLKWIARQLLLINDNRFILPLFIPLREYVCYKEDNKQDSILDFGLYKAGITQKDEREIWRAIIINLSGPHRDNVLLLLDGWDEVPEDKMEQLKIELEGLQYAFSMIITSRLSAFPKSLRAEHFYEVGELSDRAIEALVRNWFEHAGMKDKSHKLLEYISYHSDLRKMARNPFLLTVLCGIIYSQEDNGDIDLPLTRNDIYTKAVEKVYKQFYQTYSIQFSRKYKEELESFALWLFEGVENGPKYIFSDYEIEKAVGDKSAAKTYFIPSRLLSQISEGLESLYFVHTTFQEYFAANKLAHSGYEDINDKIDLHIYDVYWNEIFRFLTGKKGHGRTEMIYRLRQMLSNTDDYGVIFLRIVNILLDIEMLDGGVSTFGYDLREKIWHLAIKHRNSELVKCCFKIDADWVIDKISKLEIGVGNEEKIFIYRILRDIKHPRISEFVIEKILNGTDEEASVLSYYFSNMPEFNSLNILRDALESKNTSLNVRKRIINILGIAGDEFSIELLLQNSKKAGLRNDCLTAIGKIGGEKGSSVLIALLQGEHSTKNRKLILEALSMSYHKKAIEMIFIEISKFDIDSKIVGDILENIYETPIQKECEIIANILENSKNSRNREIAAAVLQEANHRNITDLLRKTAREEKKDKVRISAVAAMRKRAGISDCGWLIKRVNDISKSDEERSNALSVLMNVYSRNVGNRLNDYSLRDIVDTVKNVLKEPSGELGFATVYDAYLLGEVICERILEVAVSNNIETSIRVEAFKALGTIKSSKVVQQIDRFLVNALSLYRKDENLQRNRNVEKILYAASDALLKIDIITALKILDPIMEKCKIDFAYTTGYLFYKDRIIDLRGRNLNAETGGKFMKKETFEIADIGIIIALQEEMIELLDIVGDKNYSSTVDKGTGEYYYHFYLNKMDGKRYRCVASMVGNMGTDNAGLVTERIITQFKVETVVNIGIAGGIDNDLCVGDIVVGDQVDKYMATSKVIDGVNGQFEFKTSGDPFKTSSNYVLFFNNFKTAYKNLYNEWQEKCSKELQILLEKNKLQNPKGGKVNPDISVGHIACGDHVVDSKIFVQWLKNNRDRNYRAVEMESTGVANAAFRRVNELKNIVLKGISDYGDGEKKVLDDGYKGIFRKVAMRNAVYLFMCLAENGDFKLKEENYRPTEKKEISGDRTIIQKGERNMYIERNDGVINIGKD